MSTFLNATGASTLVLAALAFSGPARAEVSALSSDSDAPTKVVKLHDVDLRTTDGAQTAYDRIETAAWHVCGDMFPANNGPDALRGLECERTLVEDAVKQVDSPKLTVVYEQRTGERYTPAG
jgi:UrcA family protein